MSPATPPDPGAGRLARVIGVPGAVLMGLGSILGTGVFVSVGLAAGVAGPAVVLAVVLAAGVAACNGLSSAQLAAIHPVSGGTYEYGYRELGPAFGFTAGWMFLCAKIASAATAALGFAGYLLTAFGLGLAPAARTGVAVAAAVLLTAVVAGGIQRSNRVNAILVALTLMALAAFVAGAAPAAVRGGVGRFELFLGGGLPDLLHATATPGLVVDGQLKVQGKVPSLDEIKAMLA